MSGPYYPSTLYAGWGAWDGQGILLSTPTTGGALPMTCLDSPGFPYFNPNVAYVQSAGTQLSLGGMTNASLPYFSTPATTGNIAANLSTVSQSGAPVNTVLPLTIAANESQLYFTQ